MDVDLSSPSSRRRRPSPQSPKIKTTPLLLCAPPPHYEDTRNHPLSPFSPSTSSYINREFHNDNMINNDSSVVTDDDKQAYSTARYLADMFGAREYEYSIMNTASIESNQYHRGQMTNRYDSEREIMIMADTVAKQAQKAEEEASDQVEMVDQKSEEFKECTVADGCVGSLAPVIEMMGDEATAIDGCFNRTNVTNDKVYYENGVCVAGATSIVSTNNNSKNSQIDNAASIQSVSNARYEYHLGIDSMESDLSSITDTLYSTNSRNVLFQQWRQQQQKQQQQQQQSHPLNNNVPTKPNDRYSQSERQGSVAGQQQQQGRSDRSSCPGDENSSTVDNRYSSAPFLMSQSSSKGDDKATAFESAMAALRIARMNADRQTRPFVPLQDDSFTVVTTNDHNYNTPNDNDNDDDLYSSSYMDDVTALSSEINNSNYSERSFPSSSLVVNTASESDYEVFPFPPRSLDSTRSITTTTATMTTPMSSPPHEQTSPMSSSRCTPTTVLSMPPSQQQQQRHHQHQQQGRPITPNHQQQSRPITPKRKLKLSSYTKKLLAESELSEDIVVMTNSAEDDEENNDYDDSSSHIASSVDDKSESELMIPQSLDTDYDSEGGQQLEESTSQEEDDTIHEDERWTRLAVGVAKSVLDQGGSQEAAKAATATVLSARRKIRGGGGGGMRAMTSSSTATDVVEDDLSLDSRTVPLMTKLSGGCQKKNRNDALVAVMGCDTVKNVHSNGSCCDDHRRRHHHRCETSSSVVSKTNQASVRGKDAYDENSTEGVVVSIPRRVVTTTTTDDNDTVVTVSTHDESIAAIESSLKQAKDVLKNNKSRLHIARSSTITTETYDHGMADNCQEFCQTIPIISKFNDAVTRTVSDITTRVFPASEALASSMAVREIVLESKTKNHNCHGGNRGNGVGSSRAMTTAGDFWKEIEAGRNVLVEALMTPVRTPCISSGQGDKVNNDNNLTPTRNSFMVDKVDQRDDDEQQQSTDANNKTTANNDQSSSSNTNSQNDYSKYDNNNNDHGDSSTANTREITVSTSSLDSPITTPPGERDITTTTSAKCTEIHHGHYDISILETKEHVEVTVIQMQDDHHHHISSLLTSSASEEPSSSSSSASLSLSSSSSSQVDGKKNRRMFYKAKKRLGHIMKKSWSKKDFQDAAVVVEKKF